MLYDGSAEIKRSKCLKRLEVNALPWSVQTIRGRVNCEYMLSKHIAAVLAVQSFVGKIRRYLEKTSTTQQ